jgi:hypothetical protein
MLGEADQDIRRQCLLHSQPKVTRTPELGAPQGMGQQEPEALDRPALALQDKNQP